MRLPSIPLFVALAALSGCGEDDSACSGLSFPAPPSDTGDAVFVAAACPAAGALGTRERPFPSLAEAVLRAPAGATILVAEETSYDEQLVIDKPLRILGAAPSLDASEATVTLRPPTGPGVLVTSGAQGVVLRGLVIERAKGAGVWVTKGSSASLEGSIVHNVEPDGDGLFGYGVVATEGASLTLTGVTVDGATEVGIYIQGAAASLDGAVVKNVTRHGAIRLEEATGTVSIRSTTVETSAEVGILVASSAATIVDSSVTSIYPSELGIADGIVVKQRKGADGASLGDARADIDKTSISQIARAGVLFSDGAEGSVAGSAIAYCGTGGERGAGVWLQRGAGAKEGVLITGSLIHSNDFVGVGLTSGARARIVDNERIGNTDMTLLAMNNDYSSIGDGIDVQGGAWADIESNVIDHNDRFGVFFDHAAPDTILKANSIRYNAEKGLIVQHPDGAIPPFADNEFLENLNGDFLVLGPAEASFFVLDDDLATP